MAIKTNIYSIDYTQSPRIIWIDISVTDADARDLYDTVTHLHAQSNAMDEPHIIDAEGLTKLDEAGNKVGITVILINATYAFAPRTEWTICNMAGGNVVAFTKKDRLTSLYPRMATAYVSADRTSSVSGTLQEQEALQYASYGDVVSLNVSSPHSGIEYPVGNKEYNVNNIQNAVTICDNKGFDAIRVKGIVPLSLGDDVSYKTIVGNNPLTAILVVDSLADTIGVVCENLTFSGELDGGSILDNCILGEVKYFSGYINHCAFTSNTIFVNGMGIFIDTRNGATCVIPPTLDLANATGLGVRGHIGDMRIVNKITESACKIQLSGELIIDPSCTTGKITVYGDGFVTDNSTGDFILDDRTTDTKEEIALEVVTAISEIGYTNDVANNQIVQLNALGNEIARFDCFNAVGAPSLTDIKTMVLA